MPPRYALPGIDDLIRLGERHDRAITIYAQTDPEDRAKSHLIVKSAVDEALRELRTLEPDLDKDVEEALRAQWVQISRGDVWHHLSASVAVFLTEDRHEVYVLPNLLEELIQVGTRFDIGQLVRAVTTPQRAFALTLSQEGWNLFQATATDLATELPLSDELRVDVAEATHRATVRDRDHVRRLVGDEGRKVLLEQYARRVSEVVDAELGKLDPGAQVPLFVFATSPLLEMYLDIATRRRLVPIPGAPDELPAHRIDAAIRPELSSLNAQRVNERLARIADGAGAGLVVTDPADIARATAAGAVSTLVFDFTADVNGRLDSETGTLEYDEHGYDLLSRLSVEALKQGADVIAARPEEITEDIWTGPAVAELRFALV